MLKKHYSKRSLRESQCLKTQLIKLEGESKHKDGLSRISV